MNPTGNARRLRRQHPARKYYLDFYCPAARLSIELDGFQHGLPGQRKLDEERKRVLDELGIEELRFWNHQWNNNREGVLLEIWSASNRRTGCVQIMRKNQNNRYVPPSTGSLKPFKPESGE